MAEITKPRRRQFDLRDQKLVQACGPLYHSTLIKDLQDRLAQDFDGERAKTYVGWLKAHNLKNQLPQELLENLEMV